MGIPTAPASEFHEFQRNPCLSGAMSSLEAVRSFCCLRSQDSFCKQKHCRLSVLQCMNKEIRENGKTIGVRWQSLEVHQLANSSLASGDLPTHRNEASSAEKRALLFNLPIDWRMCKIHMHLRHLSSAQSELSWNLPPKLHS